MRHQQVIENFVKEGKDGSGTYLKARDGELYTQMPQDYRPYGHYTYDRVSGLRSLLAVRLDDGSIVANGVRFRDPMHTHQWNLLKTLEQAKAHFAVVPFHSITAAFTDGKVRNWDEQTVSIPDLKREVSVVVPSTGEEWRTVTEKDDKGREHTRNVHSLGDSVIKLNDRYYVSAVDETGVGSGMYFLAELLRNTPPQTLQEALDTLKPKVVREAEARGSNVRRQGEWFSVPTMRLTSELMADVARGIAQFREKHVLGRDGHHQVTEAVIYRAGSRKGEVYARGVLSHTKGEHYDLDLGTLRWHLLVHNVAGPSYTLSGAGGTAQFD